MTTLYLATGDGPIIINREGDQWRAARPLDIRSAADIAVDPHQTRRVFTATAHDGVWRSADAGTTWRQVLARTADTSYDRFTCVAVSGIERIDGLGAVYVGTEPSTVLRSEDDGQTWHKRSAVTGLPSASEWSFPPRPDTHHVRWIQPDLHESGKVYAAIEAGALIRSVDAGLTWRDRVPGGPRDTHQLAQHADLPGRLWSAAGDGFFVSDDGGDTWRKQEQGLEHRYCWSVAVHPGDPQVVLVSAAASARHAHDAGRAEGHLYRCAPTSDGDASWHEVTQGLPAADGTRTYALAADPVEPGVFYAGESAAVYQSSDSGVSWQRLDIDWPAEYAGSRIHILKAAE